MTGATFVCQPIFSQQFDSSLFASARRIGFIARHQHPLLGSLEAHKFRFRLLSNWQLLFEGNHPVGAKQAGCCCCSKLLSLAFDRLHGQKALSRECLRSVERLWSYPRFAYLSFFRPAHLFSSRWHCLLFHRRFLCSLSLTPTLTTPPLWPASVRLADLLHLRRTPRR